MPAGGSTGFRWPRLALGAWVFATLALCVYLPALDGPFVSDDLFTIPENAYVTQGDGASVVAVLHPTGAATRVTTNYSPVQLLAHMAEWRFFGADTRGYHVVNVLVHVVGSLLLVLLLARSGISEAWAWAAGAVFLLHPANVEAVAWISQLKTSLAFAFALAALLSEPRRPVLGLLLFTLALLAKPNALFALPVAAGFLWVSGTRDAPGRSMRARWTWLAVWALVSAGFVGAEFAAFSRGHLDVAPMHEEALVQARSIVANIGRYAAMGAAGWGLAAFHEPAPSTRGSDPWFWLGCAVVLAVGSRMAFTLFRRREEGVWWAWAVISFLPVSQVFAFTFPLADRYLYFILPGVLGAVLLAAQTAWARRDRPVQHARGRRVGAVAALAVLVFLGAQSFTRAQIWASSDALALDAARSYPEGIRACLLRARQAGRQGDAHTASRELEAAFARGYRQYERVLADPDFASVLLQPQFRRVLNEMAQWWIDALSALPNLDQRERYLLAESYLVRGDVARAVTHLERALAQGGLFDAQIRSMLRGLRAGRGKPDPG